VKIKSILENSIYISKTVVSHFFSISYRYLNDALESILLACTETFHLTDSIYALKAYYYLNSNKKQEEDRRERDMDKLRDKDIDKLKDRFTKNSKPDSFANSFRFYFSNYEFK